MDGGGRCRFVPVDVIVGFAKVKALTDSAALVVEAVKDSKVRRGELSDWITMC